MQRIIMTINGSIYRDIWVRQSMDEILQQFELDDGFEMRITEGLMLSFIDMVDLRMSTAEIREWMDGVPGIDVHGMPEQAAEYPVWPEQAILWREEQCNDKMLERHPDKLVYRLHRYECGASGYSEMRLLMLHNTEAESMTQPVIQLALQKLMLAFSKELHCSEQELQITDLRLSQDGQYLMQVRSADNKVLDAVVVGTDKILILKPDVMEEAAEGEAAAEEKGRSIRWLHFADLHMNKSGVETRRMRSELKKLLSEEAGLCDYVFFAGDLRYANGMKTDSYSPDVIPFLKDICDAAGVTVDRLFVVPGNHDVNRDESHRMAAVRKIYPSPDYRDDGYYKKGYYAFDDGSIEEEDRVGLAAGQEQFRSLMQKLYKDVPKRAECYMDQKYPHFVVTTEDLNIIHLDTTLVYTKERQRDLLLGTDMLQQVLDQLDTEKPAVILTHYSYDFLHRDEQEEVLRQLIEHQVRVWLAGHEHNILARRQRDYFYDLQCGNLYAEKGSRSSVMIGELDPVSGEGTVRAYVWHRGEGWKLYHGLKPTERENNARALYELHLYDFERENRDINGWGKDTEKYPVRSLEMHPVCIHHRHNKDYSARLMKKVGNERDSVYTGKMYLYIDHEMAPLDLLEVHKRDELGIVHRLLCGDGYCLQIHSLGNVLSWIDCSYDLSSLKDVDERLLRFQKIEKLVEADEIRLRPEGHPEKEERYSMQVSDEKIRELRMMTKEWINQMQRLAKIEQYYQIKFSLPVKPTEDEFQALYLLSDSIEHIACYILPPIPEDENERSEGDTLDFDEEVALGKPERIAPLNLFDYHFVPVNCYLPECQLIWNKEKAGWEAKEGGVPLGVDFQIE